MSRHGVVLTDENTGPYLRRIFDRALYEAENAMDYDLLAEHIPDETPESAGWAVAEAKEQTVWLVEHVVSPSHHHPAGVFGTKEAAIAYAEGEGAELVEGWGYYRASDADYMLSEWDLCGNEV